MSDTQLINQLKFRITALESNLSDRQKQLDEYKTIESQADGKIKAMTKMHAEKVKTLLNSIQVLKKEKAAVEGLSKEHKRSKLIQQLNKQILDQDIVIEVLRKFVYDDKGKQKGQQICDEIIVKTLTKGPERIRPLTREELRMEIQKLKSINIQLDGKLKVGVKGGKTSSKDNDGDISEISSVTERSFVNQNEEIFKKLKNLECENQELKLELGTKGRIIQKLKNEVKEKDKLRGQCELMVNQLEISERKIATYEKMLRESKQTMNNKIMELYERELRVQELELNTRDTSEKLKQAHESTNILVEEIKQQKQQLLIEFDLLKKENEGLMLENITLKKRQDEQKNKIGEIRDINNKNKEELGTKLKDYQQEIDKIVAENQKLTEGYRILEAKLFKERAQWVEEKSNLIAEIESNEKHGQVIEGNNSTIEEINQLRRENRDLKEALQSGGSGSDSKMLLARMQAYRLKLEFYQSKDKSSEHDLYDQLFAKYTALLEQFQNYKKQGPSVPSKKRQKALIEVTSLEQQQLGQMSSGISKLHLDDIDSDILDNFDSSYEYEMRLNQIDRKKLNGLPFMSEQDKQLLKLLNSDLWQFVKDDKMGERIQDIMSVNQDLQRQDDQQLQRRIMKIKNLSHPMGQKFTIYDSQIKQIEAMSESVSVTSAIGRQIDKFDSDIDIEIKHAVPNANVNLRGLKTISDSYNSDQNVSSVKSGDSSFAKRKKGEKQKASVLKINKDSLSSKSSNGSYSYSMNSDVSSMNINESVLDGMNSDISVDFRKKKTK